MKIEMKKLLILAVLLLLAVVSCIFAADWATSAETHAATLAGIDDKAEQVLLLSSGAALASAAISAVPGDTATPIAEELADFTTYFLLVLCVLYAEKYLVTILGAAAFRVLIPCALALVGVSLFWKKLELRQLAVKLAVVGLALFLVVPLSLRVSDMVYRVYEASIRETLDDADTLTEESAGITASSGSAWSIVSSAAKTFRDKAAEALNRFVEALAVMIVTSCIIPILVLLFFLWVIRQLTGIDVTPQLRRLRRRHAGPGEPPEDDGEGR